MVIFLVGCNLDCIYCSNYKCVTSTTAKRMIDDEVMAEIERTKDFIDVVVFSGGEPLMQYAAIEPLIEKIHALGLLVAAQTNGTYPDALEGFDGIMLDIKGTPSSYDRICGTRVDMDSIIDSIHKIRFTLIPEYWECRTVVFKGINDTVQDTQACYNLSKGCDRFIVTRGSAAISRLPLEEIPLIDLTHMAEQIDGEKISVRAQGDIQVVVREDHD